MPIVKQIPMRSHLKKWLEQQYNITGDRIILAPDDRLSKRLHGMFQYYPKRNIKPRIFKAKAYLNVQLNDYLVKHHRTYVKHSSIIEFDYWVSQQFNEELYASLLSTGKSKGDKKRAIEAFMDKYGLIEGEDINYDSLKRSFDRYHAKYNSQDVFDFRKVGEFQIIL